MRPKSVKTQADLKKIHEKKERCMYELKGGQASHFQGEVFL